MATYKVSYELDYIHQVAFVVEAANPAHAKNIMSRGMELGTIWEDCEQHRLVEDLFEEVDSGRAFELEVEPCGDELEPSPIVLADKRRAAALSFLARVANLKIWGEPDHDNAGLPFAPIDGADDSHVCLMGLIAEARELLGPDWSPALTVDAENLRANGRQGELFPEPDLDSRGIESRMTFSEALELVHAMATFQHMDESDFGTGDIDRTARSEWQRAALNTLHDVVTNHHEDIDERYERPVAARSWSEASSATNETTDPTIPSNAIQICLDLATAWMRERQKFVGHDSADDVSRRCCAMDLVRDHLEIHGRRLDQDLHSIAVVSDPMPK